MNHGNVFASALLLSVTAAAQLPAVPFTSRVAPRAAWVAVTSAGQTTPAGTPPTVPSFNTTFRATDHAGATSFDKLWVFGGSLGNNTTTTTNDLWAFDAIAGTFTQLIPHGAVGSPPARGRHNAVWNPVSNKLVVFGGNTRGATPTLLNDTWEYDPVTNAWTQIVTATSPSPREQAAMAYDPNTGGILLFGGQTDLPATTTPPTPPTLSNETWLLIGGNWVQLSPSTVPMARTSHSLVTRADSFHDVFMCCGQNNGALNGTGTALERIDFLETWSWNGTDWNLLTNFDILTLSGTTFPASCIGTQAVYDPLRKRVVVQGGNGHTLTTNTTYVYGTVYGGAPTQYTSEFDCLTNTWELCASSTAGTTPYNNNDPVIGRISRFFGGFIPATGKIYKVCGQNAGGTNSKPVYNVYEYQANPIATATSYGAGCTGPGGALALTADNLPWTSRTFSATASGFGPQSLGLGVVGIATTSVPLPLVLPLAGAGCDLLNTADATFPMVPAAGSAQLALPLSAGTALAGATLHFQVAELEFDLAFNWVGLYTTNGVSITVGAL